MSDGLQDCLQGRDSYGNIQQVCSEEEIIEVTQDGEDEVPQAV